MTASLYTPQVFPPIDGLDIKPLNDLRLIPRLRILESTSLAVQYSDHHYENNVASGVPSYNLLAFFHDILVGCCTCRLERVQEEPEPVYRLYVMTICVLKPYRRMGIASHLLETILSTVQQETQLHISGVFLNVQASSTGALSFYKKFHFDQLEFISNYYVDLDCNDAYALRLVVPQPHIAAKKPTTGKKK